MTPNTEPPSWKRFCDAPPPDGYYWSRTARANPSQYEICEVEGDKLLFFGTDARLSVNMAIREYYSQPILPPS